MTSRLSIFDRFRSPLTELSAPTTPRSLVLNKYGKAEFSMSTSDPKCTESNMQFGNLIHVEHVPTKDQDGNTNGKLPDWVGMIFSDRKWDLGIIHKVAYTMEAYLAFCPMPFERIEGSPKTMFMKIIEHANQFIHAYGGGITFQFGTVEDLPITLSDALRLSAFQHIKTLVEKASMDWDVTGEIDERGTLQLYANLYQRRGVDTDLVLTNLNSELSSPLLHEQGNLANVVFGHSQSNTPQSRHRAVGIHQTALDEYGPFGLNQTFMGLFDGASVKSAAQNYADARGRPVRMIYRIALDRQDTFSALGIGNRLTVRDTNAGFAPGGGFGYEETVRILSMDYNDLSNKAPLNLEVV